MKNFIQIPILEHHEFFLRQFACGTLLPKIFSPLLFQGPVGSTEEP